MRKTILCSMILGLMPVFLLGASCIEDQPGIAKALEEYRTAWLANDEARVMKTLTEDAILMPANSKKTIEGSKAIREYWWPAGSPFSIDEFDQPLLEIVSCGDLGYTRGTSRVAWTSTNNGVQSKSESTTDFLAVLKKDKGSWRISRLIWYQTS
jgi:ketosteroid isomerase-like protein